MIYQWVYTYTCWMRMESKTDLGMKGFGTYSWTEGLSSSDMSELKRRCASYVFPNDPDIPYDPNAEEIERFLPVAFYSFKLASGKRALVRTRYIGKGFYDNRGGALISHALVLDEGDWPEYVMEYYDSPSFWDELPEEIRTEALKYKNDDYDYNSQPPYLPSLELNDLRLKGKYTQENIAKRLSESEEFMQLLAALITAYIKKSNNTDTIYISVPKDEAPWLFAGLTMAFPKEFANNISFSTYLSKSRPEADDADRWYDVAIIDKQQLEFERYAVDLEKLVVDEKCKELILTLFNSKQLFVEFLQYFKDLEKDDVFKLLSLFRFIKLKEPIDREDFNAALIILQKNGNAEVKFEFINMLILGYGIPEEISEEWCEDILTIVKDREELRPLAFDLFLKNRSSFNDDFFKYFVSMDERYPHEITGLWLDEYAKNDVSTTGLLCSFYSLAKNAYVSELLKGSWDILFGADSLQADWDKILSLGPTMFPECLNFILLNCPDSDACRKALALVCKDEDNMFDIVKLALSLGKNDIALELLKMCLSQGTFNRFQKFQALFKRLEIINDEVSGEFFWPLFSDIIDFACNLDKNSFSWLLDKESYVPSDCLKDYYAYIDKNLPMPDQKDSDFWQLLENFLKSDVGSEFVNERAGIIRLCLKIFEFANDYNEIAACIGNFSDLLDAYSDLSADDQLKFCNMTLGTVLKAADDKNLENAVSQHKAILLFYGNTVHDNVRDKLIDIYFKFVQVKIVKNILPPEIRLIAAIKCAIGNLGNEKLQSSLLKTFAEKVFKKFDENDMDKALEVIGEVTGFERENWLQLCKTSQKKSLFVSMYKSVAENIKKII